MTKKRSSYSKLAALKYIRYYELLLDQINSPAKPAGMFISASEFGVSVSTLHNRFRDALNWLKNNNLTADKDRRPEFDFLSAIMIVEDEADGIRISLRSGPLAKNAVVAATGGTLEQADWKQQVEEFLQSDNQSVLQISNCKINPENTAWLENMTRPLGYSFSLEGNILTVAKG